MYIRKWPYWKCNVDFTELALKKSIVDFYRMRIEKVWGWSFLIWLKSTVTLGTVRFNAVPTPMFTICFCASILCLLISGLLIYIYCDFCQGIVWTTVMCMCLLHESNIYFQYLHNSFCLNFIMESSKSYILTLHLYCIRGDFSKT